MCQPAASQRCRIEAAAADENGRKSSPPARRRIFDAWRPRRILLHTQPDYHLLFYATAVAIRHRVRPAAVAAENNELTHTTRKRDPAMSDPTPKQPNDGRTANKRHTLTQLATLLRDRQRSHSQPPFNPILHFDPRLFYFFFIQREKNKTRITEQRADIDNNERKEIGRLIG